jgi:hypothetical protein
MNKLNKTQAKKFAALPTTSARIRFLTSLDYSRSEIAKTLNIRYQHVRNVQITPIKKQKA